VTALPRISAVYLAEGKLARLCMQYAEQREYRGDHVFRDELMRLCLAWGAAMNRRAE
jgi:hypothetical protein